MDMLEKVPNKIEPDILEILKSLETNIVLFYVSKEEGYRISYIPMRSMYGTGISTWIWLIVFMVDVG